MELGAALLALGEAVQRPDVPARVRGEVGSVDRGGLLDLALLEQQRPQGVAGVHRGRRGAGAEFQESSGLICNKEPRAVEGTIKPR